MSRIVAIVGRPNVGKSRLFNRLTRSRISIVHDQPGVTRDVVSAFVQDGSYTLLDTGGLGLKGGDSPVELTKASEKQVDFAIEAADLILFVVDGLEGFTALDVQIADRLRRGKKNVVLVVNKADFGDDKIDLGEAFRLGLGEPVRISAEHGRGEGELRALILEKLGPESGSDDSAASSETDDASASDEGEPLPETDPDGNPLPAALPGHRDPSVPLCVCFIGRPNVGKSSLSNRLLGSDRLIVSDIAGTTRDAIEIPFTFRGRNGKNYPFRLIDTAGIKAQTKLASPVEYFSRLRSIDAISRSDVVFLVLDAVDGVTAQDKAIAGEAIKERKPIIVIVNKWDVVKEAFKKGLDPDCAPDEAIHDYKTEREYRAKYERAIRDRLFFTPGAPILFVSAMSGYEVDRMLNAAVQLNRTLEKKIPTSKLNALIGELAERVPAPAVGGKRFRVYYAVQTGVRPFRIKLFCNREDKLSEQYRRYLEAGMVKEFGLDGCPVYFDLVGKPRHTPGTPYTGKAAMAEKRRLKNEESGTPKWKVREEREARGLGEAFPYETLED
jgi:ribosome-associated GTPase EngA